jgi:glucosamine kinase
MTDKVDFVIGLDGGGSGCRIAVCGLDGVRLAEATSGAANYTSDPDLTVAHILDALSQVTRSLGFSNDQMMQAPAHLGLAGIMTQADSDALSKCLPLTRCRISDDQVTSTVGALGDRNGALVGIGTGSFVAYKRGGVFRTLGGWGLALGDQASGAWLGRNALRHCALVADGLASPSPLANTLLDHFEQTPANLIAFAQTATPADYASFAPQILDAATAGDPLARDLVTEGATYLDQCLTAMELEDDEVVCIIGGLAARYRPWLSDTYQARIVEPQGTALDGALRLAVQLAQQE